MRICNERIGVFKMKTAIDIEEYELSLYKHIPVAIRKDDTPVLFPPHILEVASELGIYPKEEIRIDADKVGVFNEY